MSKVKLSIYLIKDGIENADIFKRDLYKLGEDFICYEEKFEKTPKDVRNFITTSHSDILNKLKTKSMSAAILKEVGINELTKRKFVVAFGFGWSLIKEECIEKNFGIKTVLNCAETDSIKRITKKSVSKNSKTSMEQMPFEASFIDFDFDGNGDILTDVTATIKQPYDFGKVTGKDSIHLSAEYTINNIDELIEILYNEYIKTTYKENFPFIDNVQLERDKKTIATLDMIVLSTLGNKEFDKIFTAIPDIVEWENFDSIKFPYRINRQLEKTNSIKRNDIEIDDFFENFDESKLTQIFDAKIILSKEEVTYKEFSFKKCLLGEIEHNNACYCLVNGNYFKTDKNYKTQIEKEYKSLDEIKIDYLIDCTLKENEYIATLIQGEFLKLDCKLVHSGYKIEICDILEKDKLIHLKKYSGGPSISHFCKQATNSALLLMNDKKFVGLANDVIKNEIAKTILIQKDYIFNPNFDSKKYCIVFGIISKDGSAKPNISFFSKLNFVQTVQNLQNIGFACAFTGIKNA